MPPAQLVLMEVEADGSAQIYRYTLDGEFAGDTWHQTQKEAEDQLVFEYGGKVGPWSEVPADVIDAHDFAVNWAQASRPEA